jgi:hypothetical protein
MLVFFMPTLTTTKYYDPFIAHHTQLTTAAHATHSNHLGSFPMMGIQTNKQMVDMRHIRHVQ